MSPSSSPSASPPSAAARAAEDPTLGEPLLDALVFLGRTAGVEIDRTVARRALERACAEESFSGPDAWFSQLKRAALTVDLNVRLVRMSAAEVSSRATHRQLPMLTLAPGDPMRGCVAVLERRGPRVLTVDPSDEAIRAWLNAAEIAAATGASGEAEPILWAYANPLRPLRPLESEEGAPAATPLKRVFGLLRLERDDVGVALVYAFGIGVVSLAAPVGVQALVNTVAFGGMLQPLVVLSLLVLVGLSFAAVLRGLQAWAVERLQQRVFARVAIDMAHRLPRVRVEAYDRMHGPELVNRFFDVFTLQKGAATLLVDGFSIALQMAVGLVVLAFYHPLLLVFDLALVVTLVGLLLLLGRGAVQASIDTSKAKYAVAGWLEEMARYPATFRGSGGADYAVRRAEDLTRGYLQHRRERFYYLFRQIVASLGVQAIAVAALLGIGGWLVIGGKLTLGQLVAAELIVAVVAAGIVKIGKQLESFYDMLAAVDKIGQLIDLPLEPARGSVLPQREKGASVLMRDIGFEYPGGPRVLAGIDLELPAGGRVALLGGNGEGKSTLVDVVCGLRRPTRGRVDIDATDLRDVDLGSLREHVALLRGPEIFDGSVADNVRVGRTDVSLADARRALESVGLWDEIASLPEGIETRLSTGGDALSRGQAGRLMVARAIVGRPRLIVVDESLDDLDFEAKRAAWAALLDRSAPWSLLLTTHDREALRGCDDIHVLEGGRLRPLRAGDSAARDEATGGSP